jgi:creatinine deaminase
MDKFMQAAIEEAQKGLAEGGIPIGSVIVHNNKIIGRGHNRRVQSGSPILHGEMDAFENAGRQSAQTYRESVIYTTLSPCSMCSGAIILYGIGKVIVGENHTFLGEEALLIARGVSVEVLQNQQCIHLMQGFIDTHPQLWNEDIGV